MGGGPHLALALRACPFPAREGMAELRSALRDDAPSRDRALARWPVMAYTAVSLKLVEPAIHSRVAAFQVCTEGTLPVGTPRKGARGAQRGAQLRHPFPRREGTGAQRQG
jgi:hypothetical protein